MRLFIETIAEAFAMVGDKLASDKEYFANALAGGIERSTKAQTHAGNMRKIFGDLLNKVGGFQGNDGKKYEGMFGALIGNTDISKIQGEVGQGLAAAENLAVDPAIYASNAKYSEKSKQLGTFTHLKTMGGEDAALAADLQLAGVKASKLKGALAGEIKTAALAAGVDPELAMQDLASGGGMLGRSVLEQIGKNAEGLSGAKTLSDAKRINEYGSALEFAKANARQALSNETKTKALYDASVNPTVTSNIVAEELEQAQKAGKLQQYVDSGLMYGFLKKNESGNIVAATGDDWVRGRSLASAGDMARDHNMLFGDMRMNTDFNPFTGEAITNVNSVRRIEDGTLTNAHVGDPGSLEAARARETADVLMNPKKLLANFVGWSHDKFKEYLVSRGINEETAETLADLATAGTGAVTAAGLMEAGHRLYNFGAGNYVDTVTGKQVRPGMKVPTGEFDPETGKPVMRELSRRDLMSDSRYRVEKGLPGKVAEGIATKFSSKGKEEFKAASDTLLESMGAERLDNTANRPMNVATNSSESGNNQSPDKGVEDKSQHHQPPSSSSAHDYNTESAKRTVAEAIEDRLKNLDLTNPNDVKARSKAIEVMAKLNSGTMPSEIDLKKIGINPDDLRKEGIVFGGDGKVPRVDLEASAKNMRAVEIEKIAADASSKAMEQSIRAQESDLVKNMAADAIRSGDKEKLGYARWLRQQLNEGKTLGQLAHEAKIDPFVAEALHAAGYTDDVAKGILAKASDFAENVGKRVAGKLPELDAKEMKTRSMSELAEEAADMTVPKAGGKWATAFTALAGVGAFADLMAGEAPLPFAITSLSTRMGDGELAPGRARAAIQQTGANLGYAAASANPSGINDAHLADQTAYLKNLENLKDLTNPVAPAYGATVQTAGGQLSISSTRDGKIIFEAFVYFYGELDTCG